MRGFAVCGSIAKGPLSKGAFCNLYSSAINALPAGAAVVYTPPKCEAGQTEGPGGRGAGGGRLVKSPPPAAVFFPRFLLGIQKKSGRRGRLRALPVAEEASKKEWQRSKFCERIANKEFRAPQQELSQQNRD